MPRKGPPPRPDSVDTARGANNYYRKVAKTRRERLPVEIPASLLKTPKAREFWERHAPLLIDAGSLLPQHAEVFAVMCLLFDDIQKLTALIKREGEIIKTPRGVDTAHPACRMLRDARRDFTKLGIEFGMTTLAESRIPKEPPEPAKENPLAAFGIHG